MIFNKLFYGDWGFGDWGLGIGDWAQSPLPNPHSQMNLINYYLFIKLIIKINNFKIYKFQKLK